jgi:hypothetical protein
MRNRLRYWRHSGLDAARRSRHSRCAALPIDFNWALQLIFPDVRSDCGLTNELTRVLQTPDASKSQHRPLTPSKGLVWFLRCRCEGFDPSTRRACTCVRALRRMPGNWSDKPVGLSLNCPTFQVRRKAGPAGPWRSSRVRGATGKRWPWAGRQVSGRRAFAGGPGCARGA